MDSRTARVRSFPVTREQRGSETSRMFFKKKINWGSPAQVLATGFGAGLAPRAPGTFGTLFAVPLYLVMSPLTLPIYLAATAALFVMGIFICRRAAAELGIQDDPAIVWDEIVGYLITMAFAGASQNGWVIAAGFVLFRIMDIFKPWPVRWADRQVHGGLGIMLDDAMAGVYAGIALYLGVSGFA